MININQKTKNMGLLIFHIESIYNVWFKRLYFRFFATCITYYNMQIFRINTKAYCLFSSPIMFQGSTQIGFQDSEGT